jgi:hypothetical protein
MLYFLATQSRKTVIFKKFARYCSCRSTKFAQEPLNELPYEGSSNGALGFFIYRMGFFMKYSSKSQIL